jgi:transcriptional regulator with XRE-family HTH domain
MAELPNRSDARSVFGANVRRRRESMGLSQEALAEASGLHRTYIGAIERGERNVGLLNIARLAEALSMSAPKLLEGIADVKRG